MVGFLEDDSCQQYGLTIEEYLHPTKETTIRIKKMMTNPR